LEREQIWEKRISGYRQLCRISPLGGPNAPGDGRGSGCRPLNTFATATFVRVKHEAKKPCVVDYGRLEIEISAEAQGSFNI